MRFELYQGPRHLGWVEWTGPGRVRVDVEDAEERRALTEHFVRPTYHLSGLFEGEQDVLRLRRPDDSPWEFERACLSLWALRGLSVVSPHDAPATRNGRVSS